MGNSLGHERMHKKIGLLGGTFDPIHFGHINLAIELREKRELDEVWFIPAHVNPHKTDKISTSATHRKNMLELAIQGCPGFLINEIEMDRDPPSYTIDTICALLKEDFHQRQYYLLMGEDALCSFAQWHQPEEIVRLVPLLIGSRFLERPCPELIDQPLIREAVKKGWTKTHMMDISGTELRLRLAQGCYCGHLIPAAVLAYIDENQLYEQ
ncbi:MAG: nicotinate (nicotinamide) nucleotide adenylyltransferase [Chlamydiales bacterium]